MSGDLLTGDRGFNFDMNWSSCCFRSPINTCCLFLLSLSVVLMNTSWFNKSASSCATKYVLENENVIYLIKSNQVFASTV